MNSWVALIHFVRSYFEFGLRTLSISYVFHCFLGSINACTGVSEKRHMYSADGDIFLHFSRLPLSMLIEKSRKPVDFEAFASSSVREPFLTTNSAHCFFFSINHAKLLDLSLCHSLNVNLSFDRRTTSL